MDSVDVFVIGGGGTGSEVAFSLARSSGLTRRARGAGQARRRMQPLRLRPHEGDAPIGEDRDARAGRRPLRPPDPRGRRRLPGGAAPGPRRDRAAVRRGRGAVRARGRPRVPPGGPPRRRAPRGARGRHRDRGRTRWSSRPARSAAVPPIPGLDRRPVLDEPRGDLEAGRAAPIARGDRDGRGRDRVRPDLRPVRLARHRAGGPPPRPAPGGRGGCCVDPAGVGSRRIDVRPGRADRARPPRRDRVDAHARGGRPGARRRAPGRDRSPSDVRAPRPRRRRRSSSIGKGTPS